MGLNVKETTQVGVAIENFRSRDSEPTKFLNLVRYQNADFVFKKNADFLFKKMRTVFKKNADLFKKMRTVFKKMRTFLV